MMESTEPITAKAARPHASVRGSKLLRTGRAATQGRGAKADKGGPNGQDLNALFAISVNSPSMSMVNFSCCVGAVPDVARGVTRRVTPQPMRATVRMEAGDHACL